MTRKKRQKSVAGQAQGVEASNKEETEGEVEIVEMGRTPAKKRKRGADREMAEAFFFSLDMGSSILRPRKDIPAFRKVLLRENDFDRIVGKRVKVFWPDSRKWFAGLIKSFNNENNLHSILYDDGDNEKLNLMRERFELEILPSEAFTIFSKLEPDREILGDGGWSGDVVNEGSLMIDRAETVNKKMKWSMSSRGQEGSSKQQNAEDSEMTEGNTMAADTNVNGLPEKAERVKNAETSTLEKHQGSEPVKRDATTKRKPSKAAKKRHPKQLGRKKAEVEGNLALDSDDELGEKIEQKMVNGKIDVDKTVCSSFQKHHNTEKKEMGSDGSEISGDSAKVDATEIDAVKPFEKEKMKRKKASKAVKKDMSKLKVKINTEDEKIVHPEDIEADVLPEKVDEKTTYMDIDKERSGVVGYRKYLTGTGSELPSDQSKETFEVQTTRTKPLTKEENSGVLEKQKIESHEAAGDKAESGDERILEEGREAKPRGSQSLADKQSVNDITLGKQETASDERPDARTSDPQTVSDDQATGEESWANVERRGNPVKKGARKR